MGKKKDKKSKHVEWDSDEEQSAAKEAAPEPSEAAQQDEPAADEGAGTRKKKDKKKKGKKGKNQDFDEEPEAVQASGEGEAAEEDANAESLVVVEVSDVSMHPKLPATQRLVTVFDGDSLNKARFGHLSLIDHAPHLLCACRACLHSTSPRLASELRTACVTDLAVPMCRWCVSLRACSRTTWSCMRCAPACPTPCVHNQRAQAWQAGSASSACLLIHTCGACPRSRISQAARPHHCLCTMHRLRPVAQPLVH